jgi:hypothetical protein
LVVLVVKLSLELVVELELQQLADSVLFESPL